MNKKDSLAILGILISQCGYVYSDADTGSLLFDFKKYSYEVLRYLGKLKLSYSFVRDIITDEYGSSFYHSEWGLDNAKLPKKYNKEKLCESSYDYVQITEEGRIGVWCETDGFVAWLDEYKKTWVVDSRKEVKEKEEKAHKEFEEKLGKLIREHLEKFMPSEAEKKIWKEGNPDELLTYFQLSDTKIHWNDKPMKIKVAKIKINGLPEYKKKGKDK